MFKTFKIVITGQVQGVGFRPFVYRLAREYDLKGTVSNSEEGVVIYAQASKQQVIEFYQQLIESPPNISMVEGHQITEVECSAFKDFRIIISNAHNKLNLQLTPDFAICSNCQNDINNPKNRRYNYPFTTCVNCGPRWAITKSFPFDRDQTTMQNFEMCKKCEDEYVNPDDRRFHSQTNSCASCGISIDFKDDRGNQIDYSTHDLFSKLKALLVGGSILAIKNTSGYLLCCDARNDDVVKKLRIRKNRPQKPFALLYPSLRLLKSQLQISKCKEDSLQSAVRPIVLVYRSGVDGNEISSSVAPGLNHLGIMLPNSGLLQMLANEIDFPIVATSGNSSGTPVLSDDYEAMEKLRSIADYYVQHNLKITHPQDDSVVKFSKKFEHSIILRRSRGYAPNFRAYKSSCDKKVLSMGAHLKSTIGFLPNDFLYLSQYLGHLDHYEVFERFTQTANDLITIFNQQPNVILVDNHPAYQSTLYGKELSQRYNAELIGIQHHKAHMASVLGENELMNSREPILGVVWDGTGFGEDGHIWGGEFFSYHGNDIKRIGHFDYFDWLAGDKMAKEPRLSLLSLLDEDEAYVLRTKFSKEERRIYPVLKNRNSLKTSSVGRLFDAVASLLDVCDKNSYEGEAAIKLENLITDYDLKECRAYVTDLGSGYIPTKSIISHIFNDVKRGVDKQAITINFLFTLAYIILQVAQQQRIGKIALSGGVFQNTVLVDMLIELAHDKYELFFNRNLSPNDENISFGQMMYYLNGMGKG